MRVRGRGCAANFVMGEGKGDAVVGVSLVIQVEALPQEEVLVMEDPSQEENRSRKTIKVLGCGTY